MSVIVTSVLLNVAVMCAMPSASTCLRARFGRAPFFGVAIRSPVAYPQSLAMAATLRHTATRAALLLRRLLLPRDRTTRPLVRPRVRVRALAPHREPTTMPLSAVAADVHETLDVHGHLRPQRTLHLVLILDRAPQTVHLVVRQLVHATVRIHPRLRKDLLRGRKTDPVNVRQCDLDPLVARQIHASDSRHLSTPAAACAADSSCR